MNAKAKKYLTDWLLLPLIGLTLFTAIWWGISALTWDAEQKRSDLPSPYETVEGGWKYIKAPFSRNEEEAFDGLGLLTAESLSLVAKGYFLSLLIAIPLGFTLGASKTFTKAFDPIFQILRPVSPLAWFPLAGLLVVSLRRNFPDADLDATTWQGIITIGLCSLWPTAVNTAVGVRSIPQDYLNVARVLKLSRFKTFTKVLLPAALPFMFTGFRLSLGVAWLVIVAVEMLSGKSGIGFFVNDTYSNQQYGSMMMSILVIGVVGFALDRLMSLVEKNINVILNLPAYIRSAIDYLRPNVGTRGFEPVKG
ncbi:MAG: ABC transporter permease [Burkholderiales bacterium]|nr:ABC transporter permease [Phycisphaerae bacterium]